MRKFWMAVMINSICFILTLSVMKEYDAAFPAFLSVSLLLIYLNCKKFKVRIFFLFFIVYLFVMTFVGVIQFQPVKVLSILLTYLIFPLYYLSIDSSEGFETIQESEMILICLAAAITDVAVSVILFIDSGMTQAVMNHHPFGGGLAVAFTPFILHLIFEKSVKVRIILPILLLFGTAIILGRIRGYMMVFFGSILAAYIIRVITMNSYKLNRILILMPILVSLLILGITYRQQLSDFVLVFMRAGESLGRRDLEQYYVFEIMKRSSLINTLFGHGMGGRVFEVTSIYSIELNIATDAYDLTVTNQSHGFHSFWLTVLYSLGFTGIGIYILFFFNLVKKSLALRCSKSLKAGLAAYIVLLVITLHYRETLLRGVLEMMTLACVINIHSGAKGQEKRKTDIVR
ncbi:MAG: hypothetical protein K0R31_2047 [Clostridiales bacterium]|nr:hypothetical protein [Clostridiales bacterium]